MIWPAEPARILLIRLCYRGTCSKNSGVTISESYWHLRATVFLTCVHTKGHGPMLHSMKLLDNLLEHVHRPPLLNGCLTDGKVKLLYFNSSRYKLRFYNSRNGIDTHSNWLIKTSTTDDLEHAGKKLINCVTEALWWCRMSLKLPAVVFWHRHLRLLCCSSRVSLNPENYQWSVMSRGYLVKMI